MKQIAILSMIAALALAGCKKKEAAAANPVSPPPPPDAAVQANPANPSPEGAAQPEQSVQIVTTAKPKPLPPPPAYLTVRAENNLRQGVSGQVDMFLTQQLHAFIQKNHRMPESFHEFVNTRLDSIPRPPEGTKWVIDTAAMQVKAVKTKQ
jgi:hypothetical protein